MKKIHYLAIGVIVVFIINGCGREDIGDFTGSVRVSSIDESGMSANKDMSIEDKSALTIEAGPSIINTCNLSSFQDYVDHRIEKEKTETIGSEIRSYLFLIFSFASVFFISWLTYKYKLEKLKRK